MGFDRSPMFRKRFSVCGECLCACSSMECRFRGISGHLGKWFYFWTLGFLLVF